MLEQFITSSLALLMMGLCLQVSLRLLYGARGPAPDDSVYLFMRILGWGLLLIPAGILFIAGANWLSVVLFAAVCEAMFELILGRRAVQRQAAWRLLAASLGGGRSAVDSLRFHQVRFSGLVGRWYRRLLGDLERGVDWQQAIWRNRRALPREAPAVAGMLDFGAGGPLLGRELDDTGDYAFQVARQQVVQRFVYLATISVIMTGIMTFTMVKIIPSYQAIFEDFNLSLPRITDSLVAFSNFFDSSYGSVLVVFVAASALAAVVVGFCYLCDVNVLRPITDHLMISRHRAWVLRMLAGAFAQGKPVDAALAQLTGGWSAYPSPLVRRRLVAAQDLVKAGHAWQDALRESLLITGSDVAVLAAAQDAGNLPWAMRMLADRKLRLTAFRWSITQQIFFTVIVLLFGLFVLWVGVAMLIPLADLVQNLAL